MNDKKLIVQLSALNLLLVMAIAESGLAANLRADLPQGSITLSETLEYTPPNDGAPDDRHNGTPGAGSQFKGENLQMIANN